MTQSLFLCNPTPHFTKQIFALVLAYFDQCYGELRQVWNGSGPFAKRVLATMTFAN